jgi:hypothetical protein
MAGLLVISDLKTITNKRFKIFMDESWQHEVIKKPGDEIWYYQLHCPNADSFISLYSLDPIIFHFSTDRPITANKIWQEIKNLPDTWADFHFDGEAILYFPPELVIKVAKMAGARKKRRRATEAEKAVLAKGRKQGVEALIAGGFMPGTDEQNTPNLRDSY